MAFLQKDTFTIVFINLLLQAESNRKYPDNFNYIFTASNSSCGKVMFSQACVIRSVHRGGGIMASRGCAWSRGCPWQGGGVHGRGWVCMAGRGVYMAGGHASQGACVAGGMHGKGGWGCAWQGACMAKGACMAVGKPGRGHAWQGVCMVGGVCGRGHVWQGHAWQQVCMDMAGETATEAGNRHPIGNLFDGTVHFTYSLFYFLTQSKLKTCKTLIGTLAS